MQHPELLTVRRLQPRALLGGREIGHPEATVHLVADPEFRRQLGRDRGEDPRDLIPQLGGLAHRAVQDRPGHAGDHHRNRDDGPESFGAHRERVIAGDAVAVAIVADRRRTAGGHDVTAQPTALRHSQSLHGTGTRADELRELGGLAVGLASEHHRQPGLLPDLAKGPEDCVRITGSKGGHCVTPESGDVFSSPPKRGYW